jgi:hypothetical protein
MMRWKYVVLFIFGALVGGVEGGLHGQSWNRPVHYTSLITVFVIFPVVFIGMALTIRSLKEFIKLVIVTHVGWIVSWSISHCIIYGWVFDDPILMTPAFILANLSYSVVIHEIRFILPERMKEEDFIAAVFSTGRIICGKARSALRSLKPVLQRPEVRRFVIPLGLFLLLIVVLFHSSLAVGALVFKFSDKAEEIRQGIGREVTFYYEPRASVVKGTLTEVGYQYEWGRLWIIFMRVNIEYVHEQGQGGGSISSIISPFELDRIEFVEKQD